VAWGIGMQFLLAIIILKTEPGRYIFAQMAVGVSRLLEFADRGSAFVFGSLADPAQFGELIFAFKVLPIIIFISSLFTVLYYLGIMQRVVLLMAKVMHRFLGVSGSESLAAAANVFMGQTEAPIIIAPYIPKMTTSELMALMTGGMATVSGAVLAAYAAFGVNPAYLLTASVMAAPASLVLAKLLIPETEESKTAGNVTLDVEAPDVNIIDAAARGAGQGITLALNVGGMLVAFIALIWLLNGILGAIGNAFASTRGFLTLLALVVAIAAAYLLFWNPTSRQRQVALIGTSVALLAAVATFLYRGPAPIPMELQSILGTLFAPVAFIMGVPWEEAGTVGQLFGIKLMLNEFVAYAEMSQMLEANTLSPKAELIASYALCGFANFSSIGIQIGGIGGLAPTRKSDLARLGLRAVLGGMMASYTVATIAGLLSSP
jgi:CNT family concentrative nucleoside transporter